MIAEYEDWYKECWYALLLSIMCEINPDSAHETIIKGRIIPYLDDLLRMREEGMTYPQIEKTMRMTNSTVHKTILSADINRQKEMVKMWESGKSLKEICDTMKTTTITIHKALKEEGVIR
jgi:hypothetical protein